MFQILTRLAVKRAEPILVTAAHKREVISKAMKSRLSRTTNSTLNRIHELHKELFVCQIPGITFT